MTMMKHSYDYSTTPSEDVGPPIGDPAEPLWRSRRNARILSAVHRIGQHAAQTAAQTDTLRAAKRRHERLVQHLLPGSIDSDGIITTRRPVLPEPIYDPQLITPGAHDVTARDDPVAEDPSETGNDIEIDKWLDSQIRSNGRWRRLLSVLRRQSALLSPSARCQLQLSESEEMLVQRALQTEAEETDEEDGGRSVRRQLMLQVWQREADHRHQQQGPPTRRSSEPRTADTPDEAEVPVRRRHQSAEPQRPEPADWTAGSVPPTPPSEQEESAPPAAPSFPMQDPGKEVEIKETEIQIQERPENEWTAEWDWAERERRARSRTSQLTAAQSSVSVESSSVTQSSVLAESSRVTVQRSEVAAQGSEVASDTGAGEQQREEKLEPQEQQQLDPSSQQQQQQETPEQKDEQRQQQQSPQQK